MKKILSVLGVMVILGVMAAVAFPASVLADSSTLYWSPVVTTVNQTSLTQGGTLYAGSSIAVGESFLSVIPAYSMVDECQFYLQKNGSPPGNLSCTVRNDSTHALIGTLGTMAASSLTGGGAFVTFNTPVSVGSATSIDISIEYNSGDSSDNVQIASDSNNVYAGGAYIQESSTPSWSTVSTWDCTFQNLIYSNGSGNFNAATNWATSSGGTPSHAAPGATNSVIFDANSFSGPGQTVTCNSGSTCNGMDWTAATNNPTFVTSSFGPAIAGNLTLNPNITISGGAYWSDAAGSGSQTWNASGCSLGSSGVNTSYGGGISLGGNLTTTGIINPNFGSFTTNNYAVNCTEFLANGAGVNITLGTSTITCGTTASGTCSITSGVNLSAASATIICTFITGTGGGYTIGTLQLDGTGTNNVNQSDTFGTLALDGGASQIVKFTDGSTTTANNLTTDGLAKTLEGTSTGGWTISCSTGTISLNNSTIDYSTTSGSATFDAFKSNGNTLNNDTGWLFTIPATVSFTTPSGLTKSTATLNGSLTSLGGDTSASVTVYWGLTDGGTTAANWQYSSAPTVPSQPMNTLGNFSLNLTNLPSNTQIYYSATVTNGSGASWLAGGSLNFTTKSVVQSFPLMMILLQVVPAILFLLGLFGAGFFAWRLTTNRGKDWINLILIVSCVLGLIAFLAIFSAILSAFYQILSS
jgi:hypothetical protein